ncbi:hypothetical protein LG200_07385 [Methylobacillus caricis]|uniref:hypothetical protein n=1 Tax=Methylobacillus caricis TaxID=1971611 RepID=UPI001CFF662E|nr:hypothetical protein [Methylobacillus caricis]MCB5187825.1 hypothetical protein [Methylobacillus caricis]
MMKQVLSVITFVLLAATGLSVYAQGNQAMLDGQVLAAANLNPINGTFDAHVAEIHSVITSKDIEKTMNNRPHPKYGFNMNRINTTAEKADRNMGKHFVYVTHPKDGFKIKRYVG